MPQPTAVQLAHFAVVAHAEPEAAAGLASQSLVNQAPGEVEKKYDVLAVNLVCTWKFGDGFTDTCAICKASLYEASLDCQAHNIEDKKHDGWHLCTGECCGSVRVLLIGAAP